MIVRILTVVVATLALTGVATTTTATTSQAGECFPNVSPRHMVFNQCAILDTSRIIDQRK